MTTRGLLMIQVCSTPQTQPPHKQDKYNPDDGTTVNISGDTNLTDTEMVNVEM